MPKLTERIRTDLTAAMKAREAAKLSTLRLLQAALKNEQIEKGHELSDEEAEAVIRRAVKQRNDSIEQYEKGGRTDLAGKERAEVEVLEGYLPKGLSDDELEMAVREAIATTAARTPKELGAVMKELMSKHRGRVDGKKAQELAAKILK